MASGVCVITGVGPGNGAALSRRFASAGYRVAMLARSEERLRSSRRRSRGRKVIRPTFPIPAP